MSKTLTDLKLLVVEPLDLQESIGTGSFLDEPELTRIINKSIKKVESLIHTIYEDYFLDVETLPIVRNVRNYSLPNDIYASKIRKMLYSTDATKYTIRRIRQLEDTVTYDSASSYYVYMLTNKSTKTVGTALTNYVVGTKVVTFSADHKLEIGDNVEFLTAAGVSRGNDIVASIVDSKNITIATGIAALIATDTCTRTGGEKIAFYPTPATSEASAIKLYYIREAKQLVNGTDICDIPEFEDLIVLNSQFEILKKEVGNPTLVMVREELTEAIQRMVDTLQKRIPDEDNELIGDYSAYEDYDDWFGEV